MFCHGFCHGFGRPSRPSRELRDYIAEMRAAAVKNGIPLDDAPLGAWLAWVESYADRIDPMLPAPAVPADPEPQRLYGYSVPESPWWKAPTRTEELP
ncbi:MAG: hypothetical protein ACR2GG_06510 [Gemmatimonadaceae bacterium]